MWRDNSDYAANCSIGVFIVGDVVTRRDSSSMPEPLAHFRGGANIAGAGLFGGWTPGYC